jgi:endonuclease/exonuclease/phosphatase family metal-dependent hydrolase
MGDINEWFPPSPGLRSMNRHLGPTPALPSFPSRLPVLALDRIWVRPRGALVALAVHRSALARIASDHLPVRAELVLPDE